MSINILIVTHFPSPYQVELFNEIKKLNQFFLNVGYLHQESKLRFWKELNITHSHYFSDEEKRDVILKLVLDADLIILNYYRHPLAIQVLDFCVKHQKSWCFWGERPGYGQYGFLGILYRKIQLHKLHQNKVPIWGIGKYAVQKYQQEFGLDRTHINFPYFSNLSRFDFSRTFHDVLQSRTFLYSGALIYRKGVDLLAKVFCNLAHRYPFVRLNILGTGNLDGKLHKILSNVIDKVRFLGFQDWPSLPQFYQQADFLCVPSRYDGWGLVVTEGLAAGVPVISTDRTGAALEFIENRTNGWLIPHNNEQALYRAMEEAALLPLQELSRYSFNAQNSVSHHQLSDGVNLFSRLVTDTIGIRKLSE